ncbi:MAG: cardiolipin synthase [Bacteroidales bacterium]|nr:cardiolipin synthase [Bacteroidales bacterium]MCL2133451.1 cardiolipin synthase [Bacteroidales bacterium]
MDFFYLLGLWLQSNWVLLLWGISFLAALIIIVFLLLSHLDPIKTLSWIIVIILLPYLGIFLYLLFGQNYRKRKIYSRKGLRDAAVMDSLGKKQIMQLNITDWEQVNKVAEHKNIITLLLNNSRALLTGNNRVEVFHNGRDTFAAMKECIAEAKDSIHLLSYIIEDDTIGNEFKDLLIQKSEDGVEVRLMFDSVGSRYLPRRYIRELKAAGVEVYSFAKVAFPWLSRTLNYRNHRKILVVDGTIGFLGGINIADRYMHGLDYGAWRDTHLRIEGQAVHSLQASFLLDWFFASKKQLGQRPRYYPSANTNSDQYVQIVPSGPDSDWASIMQAYFSAITKAKEHIYILTPYFTPADTILSAIKIASLSGVDVRLMLPKKSDAKFTYWSTMSYISELLQAGVKIYLYKNGFNHSKVITVDGSFAAIGSANMDSRSFEHNFEISAMIYDKEITARLEEQIEKDFKNSRLVRRKRWERRKLWRKLLEGFSRLLSPLL